MLHKESERKRGDEPIYSSFSALYFGASGNPWLKIEKGHSPILTKANTNEPLLRMIQETMTMMMTLLMPIKSQTVVEKYGGT